MGTGYDGVCFFGIVYNGEDGWPEETKAVLGGEDLWDWLDVHLGLPHWSAFSSHAAYKAERERRCVEAFGVPWFIHGRRRIGAFGMPWFEQNLCMYINYIAPAGAIVEHAHVGYVPPWSTEQIATWRAALAKLQAVLPGGSEPGLHFGCFVG